MTLKMTKTKSKITLADQIAALNNPAPSYDPEDASDTETRAQLVEFDDDVDDTNREVQSSKLRKKNSALLADGDKRYAGQATSRKSLDIWEDIHKDNKENTRLDDVISSDEEMHSDNVTSEDEELDPDEERNTKSIRDQFKKLQSQMEESSSDADDDEKSEEDGEDDDNEDDEDDSNDVGDSGGDDDDDEEEYLSNQEMGSGVKAFSEASISEEVAKGKATKTQLTLWDAFMESRIKIQKALAIANQLPSYDKQPALLEKGGREVQDALHSGSKQLRKLLTNLIDLQQGLLLGNQSTRHIVEGKQQQGEQSDEEIMSSEDDDDGSAPQKQLQKPDTARSLKRKADVKDIGEFLAKRHTDFAGFQNETIQKWHAKTKLATGKQSSKSFSSFEKSALSQIQQVLQDKQRLVRRTQLRRTVYRRLGDDEEDTKDDTRPREETEETGASVNSHLKDYDEETFDDDDFYHQLLRDLIEKRTSSTSDPVQLTRQWLEVQKLRRKIKKKVDTKASKGRKIRYDVHAKLVSFMPAQDTGTMRDEARDELFSSLFGKRRGTAEDVQ